TLTDKGLKQLHTIDRLKLGGTAASMLVEGDKLWTAIPSRRKVVAIELASGEYNLVKDQVLRNDAGQRIQIKDILIHNDHLLVSTGSSATVELFGLANEDEIEYLSSLNLSYLIKNGNLEAGEILIQGQTLYVAAGHGDLQLFDISPWFERRYRAQIDLQHYFSVLGAANTMAFASDAVYVGTSFVYNGQGEAIESPISLDESVNQLGGGLNTIVNDLFLVTEQIPEANGNLAKDAAVEIQLNQIVDNEQFEALADQLLEVSLDGAKVAGFVSRETNVEGSRLIFRAANELEVGKRYRVQLASGLRSISGQTLDADYSFNFVVSADNKPEIESVVPEYGSWRGENEITILGSNFNESTRVKIGGVESTTVNFVSENQITAVVPALENSPAENRLVGLSVHNEISFDFKPASYTYVADPRIDAIGTFDTANRQLDPSKQKFLFNANEYLAIEGAGLNSFTSVEINGQPAANVEVVNDRTISMPVPANTIGTLEIALFNEVNEVDKVVNSQLTIEFDVESHLSGINAFARYKDFAAMVKGDQLKLYITNGSSTPSLISDIEFDKTVKSLVMHENYIAVLDSDGDVTLFDYSNPYDLVVSNTIFNVQQRNFDQIRLNRRNFLLFNDSTIYLGNINGAELKEISVAVVDAQIQSATLELLLADQIQVRSLADPELIASSNAIAISNPSKLQKSGFRSLVSSSTQVQLFAVGPIENGATIDDLGSAALINNELHVNGELAVVSTQDNLLIFDLDIDAGQLVARQIAQFNSNHFNPAQVKGLVFEQNLIEWQIGSSYYNSEIPLANITTQAPQAIGDEFQQVSLTVVGDSEVWDQVTVDLIADSSGLVVPGFTQLINDQLSFQNTATAYQLGETYKVELFNQPNQLIDGGEVNFDLPVSLGTYSLFGMQPFGIERLLPANTISGRATNFVLTGSQLDQVESIEVAGATLPSGDFSVNSSGTELTFNLLVNEPGIYSLVANQPGQSEILTAAILVAQALRIDSVMTDNPAGTNLVSDTRGNKISISGAGFEGVLKVHFFEDSPGFEADESNLQSYEFDAGALTFTSPNTVPGRVYKTIIKRDATNETVEATDRLTSVDDTQPFVEDIQTISRANPLVIVLNEAAQASGFSVIKHFKDYSNTADEDVSSRFELEVVNKSITLRLREGQVFDSNSSYSIQINGIADTANNLVVNRSQFAGGVFTSEFVSNDILSPINLGVVRSSDDVAMTPGMLLTRGRSYEFAVDATDNYDDELSYEIRISVNGGISFGPVQKVNSQAFEIAILEDYSNIVVRLTAYDASGNFKSEDFSASVVDPVINASTVYTTPDKVEEKSHSKIHFDITGDADLVTKVDMIVEGKGFHAAYQLADWNSATATIQYLNPKLTDISPRTDVEVTLKINFGYSGYLEVNDSYLLNEDATPPTISIVSPQDGDRVPLDITTDVIIQSFDKFGIEEVAVAINGGDFVALDQINRYQFTPVSTDPVTLQARATDPNNNTGLSQIITLQPFDATLGEPRVEIVNPADGSTFRESQKVNFEILMANVTDATLYMDVGGSETDPRNPAPLAINRADEDPQRFTVQVEIPATDENVVVIARLESGVLNSKKFINVLRDTGIDENLEVRIEPSETVLTGTGIRITADVPSEMVDYSEDSNVEVRDPEASASGTNYPMQQLDKLVSISNEAGQVLVSSELIDLSNHSKVEESRLNKTQFLGAIRESVIDLSNSASLIGKALVVPGDDDLVVALESVEGYQVQQGSNTILDESGVAIGDIFFNGEYLVVEDNQEGLTRIHLIKKNSNGWDAAITHPVQGKIHAVLGNNLLFTYGNLLSSVQINQGQLVPSVGHLFQEEIHQVQSLGATVLVQTASGINLLSLNNLTNALELDAFYAINSLVGSVLHDRYLTIWTDKQLVQYEVLNNLEIVQTNTVELDSEILEYLVDDELLLFKLANAQLGSYWKLSQDLNTLGYLTDDAKQILVGNGRYYFIRDNSIESQALVTDLTGQSLSLAVNNNIHGWTIGGLKSINGLGQETVVVTDTSSNNVVYTFADKSRDTIFVSRGNFVGGDLNVVVTESNGTQHSVAINLIAANASNLVATSPQNNATITQEALVPVNLEYAQDARIENQQITVDGVEVDLASSVNGAIGWLRADPQATQQSLNISVNSNEVSVNQLDLIEANTELGRVTIIHPQNNQQFIEGEWLDVDYRIVDDTSDEFKYTEVALLDFNQNIISLQLVNAEEGKVSIRLSGLVEQDNYTVRVRGYYGDSYRYSQRTVGISVIPKNERLNIELSGVPYEVMQGSIMIPVAVVNNLPVTGSITIDVTDENGTPIVSGADSVEFSAPNVTKLMVKATANDGVGNQASTTLESRVISPFALASNANQVDFDVALAGVEQSYFADGSELVDHTGQTLKELNGQVTAMTYVNDRLLVAYSGQGLFFLDHKDDFGFLGRYESQQDYVQLVTFENKLLALTALGELELFSIEGNSLQKIEEYF
ncbi:MAG: IPT/TIG domain-containing protein, partial [Kangiellaceae bacterium]|nr:IPT/TIG domain-containing protein [Kangiellaceae bacterium]